MIYNINYDVDYNDNSQFRNALRNVFSMNCVEDTNNDVMDDESRDELFYDNHAVTNCLTFILNKTQNNPLFKEIYLITAGRVLSNDLGIGLTILFSYDNFKSFHLLLRDFFHEPSSFNENTLSYINLKNHII